MEDEPKKRQAENKGLVTSIACGLPTADIFSMTDIQCFALHCVCAGAHIGICRDLFHHVKAYSKENSEQHMCDITKSHSEISSLRQQ